MGTAAEVEDGEDPEPVDEEVVPLSFSASAWNAVKLFGPDSTALAEKTIPCPQ